ncbi:MAG: hypothetical protein AMXMBFR82_33970 [Candidatus Hydrogenedentota bacterium]
MKVDDVTGVTQPARWTDFPKLGRVCRAGLATRGDSELTPDDIALAIEHGVNYLNWCGLGHEDGLVEAIRSLGKTRKDVFVAVQFLARTADDARRELNSILESLRTDYVDVLTYYYVEHVDEWAEIAGAGGASEVVRKAKASGVVRSIGLTSHQRPLAASIAGRGEIDMIMVRYNAAHRGAEQDVFPVTRQLGIPVVAYTALRWGALMNVTPDDPTGFCAARAPDWYRFVLMNPDVTVGIMAPQTSAELREDLEVPSAWRGLNTRELEDLRAHGARVRKHAGRFP